MDLMSSEESVGEEVLIIHPLPWQSNHYNKFIDELTEECQRVLKYFDKLKRELLDVNLNVHNLKTKTYHTHMTLSLNKCVFYLSLNNVSIHDIYCSRYSSGFI